MATQSLVLKILLLDYSSTYFKKVSLAVFTFHFRFSTSIYYSAIKVAVMMYEIIDIWIITASWCSLSGPSAISTRPNVFSKFRQEDTPVLANNRPRQLLSSLILTVHMIGSSERSNSSFDSILLKPSSSVGAHPVTRYIHFFMQHFWYIMHVM